MYNKVIFAGNLTRNPEIRYTSSGTAVTTITLAVNTKVKQGDEYKDEVLFIDAVVFGRQAENIVQYLGKGNPVIVDGRLRERRWEYEGKKMRKMEVVSNNVRFLPKGSSNGNGSSSQETEADPEFVPPETTELEPF